MTKFHSKVSVFLIDDAGATQRDISAYITDISGIPGGKVLVEDTTLGSEGWTHTRGIYNTTISLAGMYDDTATSGPDVVLEGLSDYDTAVDWEYGPKGSSSTFPKYSGTGKVQNYELGSRVGQMVTWSCDILVQGTVTYGTFS